MTIMKTSEIEFARTVIVTRPGSESSDTGDYNADPVVIIPAMTADIQQSLKIRNHLSEDGSGTSDTSVWFMFCLPPVPLRQGDIVTDTDRIFIIDSAGDWGSHVECIMRLT